MKKNKKVSLTTKVKEPKKDGEIAVTKRFLDLRIQEVKGDISSLRLETRAGFTKIDARFLAQEARFESMDTKLTKIMVILEDQNDRNRAVLDAYTTVYEKLIETNTRVDKVEERVFGSKQK